MRKSDYCFLIFNLLYSSNKSKFPLFNFERLAFKLYQMSIA